MTKLGYHYNLYTSWQMFHVHEIWLDLINNDRSKFKMKHKFSDYGSVKLKPVWA